ncbi:MAG: glucose 1-dehydrogenase [Chloroflexi bacterium]|nr:glucose 1-dehydrogenase [Chloroflexota bacterium]
MNGGSPMRLDGKTALVTGAARGIGRAIALRLASEGVRLAVADLDFDAATQTAAELGPDAVSIRCDVSQVADARAMVKSAVAALGHLDILVNNAGVAQAEELLETTEAAWDRTFAVNTKGLFFCLQAAALHMRERRTGKIVNLASMAGRVGVPILTAYAASKASVISITRSAALDLARYGINVNAVCPGIDDTEMWRKLDEDWAKLRGRQTGQVFAKQVQSIPLGRAETAEDVAGVVAFLCSPDADYVTGQAYNVCGGLVHS